MSLTRRRTDTITKSQLATSQLSVINSQVVTVDEQLLLSSIREVASCYQLAWTSHRDDVIMTSLEVIFTTTLASEANALAEPSLRLLWKSFCFF